MKIIGFDLDGVLYPWQQAAYDWCIRNGYYKEDDWDTFWEVWLPSQSKIFNDNLVKTPTLYHTMYPTKKQVEFLQRLGRSHMIYYVTQRPPETEAVTINFLKAVKYPQIENLIYCSDKVPVVIQYGIELFVDDRHFNANAVAQVCKSLLMNQSYNLHKEIDPRVIRISTIYEVEQYLDG
jgi:uncharacterized HAD superfamily protein